MKCLNLNICFYFVSIDVEDFVLGRKVEKIIFVRNNEKCDLI